MTAWQRAALSCRLTALSASIGAVWLSTHDNWIPAASLCWGALVLAVVGGRCQHAHLFDQARHERARRAAAADSKTLNVPIPCCSYWRHSGGTVHGPDCARPPEARYVMRNGQPLDEVERAAFDAITASLDLPGHDKRGAA
ncbi:hypothetical protein [Streptomyces sp. NPDC020489]|uniref:hypothetical protein n=1 Tax=Streptomyces sp. NPDC020489 TaxID=3365077 RepID=UPI0037A0481B